MEEPEKARLLQRITENVPGVIIQYQLFPDGRSCFPYASEALKDICGLSPVEVLHDASRVFEVVDPNDLEKLLNSITESARLLIDWNHEFRFYYPTPEERWLQGYARPEAQSDGSVLWHGFLQDITQRKKLEEELIKVSRLNLLNGKINSMIIHAKDHERLFEEACQIMVEDGQFKLAWIGLIDPDITSLVVAKCYGPEADYIQSMAPIFLSGDEQRMGPTARAIREGKVVVNNDTCNNLDYLPWREEALKRGFHSSISLPLKFNETIIGALNIYSERVNYFNATEVSLLEEIARNVSYAITVIYREKALVKSELSFRTIFEEAPMGIALIDSQTGHFKKINSKYLEIIGRKLEEIKTLNWMSFTHPDDLSEDLEKMELLKSGKISSFKMIKRYFHSNGSIAWVEISVVPFFSNEPGNMQHLCMVENISERVRYEEELRSALKVRDEFLSIASHELKTPITSLKLQVQLIKREIKKVESPEVFERHSKALDMASRQTDRLTFLIDNLLDVTRLESGQFNIVPLKFNLSQVLLDTLYRFQGLLIDSKCELMMNVAPDVEGTWDQGRIEQVLVNLISNAIKYAPEKPIAISLFVENDDVNFSITDNGPGLTEADKYRIFNQFERVKSNEHINGLGLGLYISKKIIDSHRGVILVESEEGLGSTFTVKLPLT